MHGLALLLMLAAQTTTGAPTPNRPAAAPSPRLCEESRAAMALATNQAAEEICLGEGQRRIGDGAEGDGRSTAYRQAVAHLRKAVSLLAETAWKARVLDALAVLHDRQHLDEPGAEEAILRELSAARPDDPDPLFRLARVQELVGFTDAAEDTLVGVRRRYPQVLEPYHRLAQFYARQAGVLQSQQPRTTATPPAPGTPDDKGAYRVGAGIAQPRREGTPRYPDEALSAGIEGVVICELLVDAEGRVAEAAVVRSIPLLDDAALAAVRTWRYEPTLVNGQPVPVRLVVTVNFTRR